MFTIKCACGSSEKNFKFDIGPSFVNDCCLDNGFDELGNKKALSNEELTQLTKDPEVQAPDLEIKDDPKLDAPTDAEKEAEKDEADAAAQAAQDPTPNAAPEQSPAPEVKDEPKQEPVKPAAAPVAPRRQGRNQQQK